MLNYIIKTCKEPLIVLSIFAFFSGCGKSPLDDKKDIIAYVNREPIFASDLKREIALKARQDPTFKVTPETKDDQLDMIINRKLIIQEAMEKGLAREDRFVNTIRSFWEQALIRDFINYKKSQFQDYLFVTDDEVNKFYDNISKRITFKILKSKDKRYIDNAHDKFIKNIDLESMPFETVGPVGYEEITSSVLQEAFEMPIDEAKKFEDAQNHYLIMVANVDRVAVGPQESLKPEIEKRIATMKERRLFEEWLKEKRERSNIKFFK